MPVYPRLNFPINRSPIRSSANSSHDSEGQSVPRLRGRRSMQQGLRSSTAGEHSVLDGINYQLDDMAKRNQDPLRSSAESSTRLREKINDVLNSTERINTPTRDAAFQRAEDARIAAAWRSGREATPAGPAADPEPLVSLPFTKPSKQRQATTNGNRQQEQPDIFSDPNIMVDIAHSDQELERMKNDLAIAKADQAKAEEQLYATYTPNGPIEKQQTPIPKGKAGQQTPSSFGGASQHILTPIPNGIKKEQQTPFPNGTKQPQQQTPMSNGVKKEQQTPLPNGTKQPQHQTPMSNGVKKEQTPFPNGTKQPQQQTPVFNGKQEQIPVSNGKQYPATPLSVDSPKYIANTAAVVETSTKIKELTKEIEVAGWEMQTVKQDLGEVRDELEGVRREVSWIKGGLGEAKKEVKTVHVEVSGLKSEIVCLREILETVSGQVGMLARNLESTSGQMTELGKGMPGMKHDMEGLKEQVTNLTTALKTLTDLATRVKNILAAANKTPFAAVTLPNTATTTTPSKNSEIDPFNSSTPRAPGTFPTTPASSASKTQTQSSTHAAPVRAPGFRDSTTWSCICVAFQIFWCCVIAHRFLEWSGYEEGLFDEKVYKDIVEVIEGFF